MNQKELTEIASIQREALSAAENTDRLEQLRIALFGKNGQITLLLKQLSALPVDERKTAGQNLNLLKNELSALWQKRLAELKQKERSASLARDKIDLTLPGRAPSIGHEHPLSATTRQIELIFRAIGYDVAYGPEIETDYYNFEALNFPPEHPARDEHDTFFLPGGYLLRTHTSPVQARLLKAGRLPLRVLIPGRVYRSDEVDASHSPVFTQIEGLVVGENISLADLKGTLTYFLKSYFGPHQKVRFRPSFFPFTEPSAEVDVQCILCAGAGCRLCKDTGWVEILGAGLVDPHVLQNCDIDPDKYTGFAFGMGVERIAILRYGIEDIRLFAENDLRFLRQF